MPFFSQEKIPSNNTPANELASQSTQRPQLVCTWSAHAPQSGSSPSPLPRFSHTLTATGKATGKLFLFGGRVLGEGASRDLYVLSTWDFSTTLLQTSGEVPTPRDKHVAALIDTTLLIFGGKGKLREDLPDHDSLYLLNLESREWSRVVANGPGPGCPYSPYNHTTTVVGSKLFIFGGWIKDQIGWKTTNDIMWTLDLNCLKSQPHWESYEPMPGNEKPLPRAAHTSVTTEDRIIIFGGYSDKHDRFNDTWSFDISTRKWTELQCTGSIPSPRARHAAVLVDDVMYVFGGLSTDEGQYSGHMDDLYALQLSTQRWFGFHNEGPSPRGRSAHTMASDGTRVFVLGGYSKGARLDEVSLIHVFDTKDIKYPDPERVVVNFNEKTTQLSQKSSTGPPTHEQLQYPKSSSSEAHGASSLQNATPAVSGLPASLQITHERNPDTNGRPFEPTGVNSKPRRVLEDGVSEDSTEYHAEFAAPHSSSEAGVANLEYERTVQLERQLSESLTLKTERDQRITWLTDELALNCALLEHANAAEGRRRAIAELREPDDRLVAQTSLVKQRDAELVDTRSKLRDTEAKLDESLLSFSQQIGRYAAELVNVRAELEAKKSELEAVRLRLTDANDGWARSKTKAGKLHTVTAASLIDLNEDRDMCNLKEDKQDMKAELASPQWNEKSIEG